MSRACLKESVRASKVSIGQVVNELRNSYLLLTSSMVEGGEVRSMSRACLKERLERGTPDTFNITSPSCYHTKCQN